MLTLLPDPSFPTVPAHRRLFSPAAANRSALLGLCGLAGAATVPALVGWTLGPAGAVGGLAGGLLVALVIWATAEWRVRRALGARPVDEATCPRLVEAVTRACVDAGLARPRLYVAPGPPRDARALGRSADHAAIVATTAMVDDATADELDAALRRELARIANRTAVAGTITWALRSLRPVPRRRRRAAATEPAATRTPRRIRPTTLVPGGHRR